MSTKDIVIVCDYHNDNMQFLVFNAATGEEREFKRPTCAVSVREVLEGKRKGTGPIL